MTLIAPDLLNSLGEQFSIAGFAFFLIGHVRRDIHQTDDDGVISSLSDDASAVAVAHEDAGSVLLRQDAPGGVTSARNDVSGSWTTLTL